MSVESITKSSPAAPSRETGSARVGVHPPRQRTRPPTSPEPSARSVASEQRARASRAWFLGILLGLLGLGLVALLLLNTASAQDAFRLHDLQTRAADLSRQEQALSLQASVLADPGTLAARAGKVGMVPGGDPRFLAPGAPLPAACQPVADGCVVPAPKPSLQPSAQPGAQPNPPAAQHPSPRPVNTQASGKPSASSKPAASAKPTASSKPTVQAGAAAVTPGKAGPSAHATPTPTAHRAPRQTVAPASSPAPAPARSAAASRRAAG
ncbi:MAG: hypothetical protein ACXV5Q_05425 [Frankiaceae bacterium]